MVYYTIFYTPSQFCRVPIYGMQKELKLILPETATKIDGII